KNYCVSRQRERACDPVVGVVVSLGDDNANSFLIKPAQLIAKEYRDLHIRRIVVVKVASKKNKRHLLVDREVDQFFEGLATGATHARNLGLVTQDEGLQR